MTTVFLIRHCQAEGNIYRMIQGFWDGDVTELGRKQIEALRNRIKDEKIDRVYSSDLYRAYLTAFDGVASDRNIGVTVNEELRELNMGKWEGQFFGNIDYELPEESQIFMFDAEKWTCENAETFSEGRERIYNAIESIAKENDGKTIAICSHGEIMRCFLSKVLGVNLADVDTLPICKNTAISKLTYDNGKFSVIYKNDYSHLGDLRPGKWNSVAAIRDKIFEPFENPDYYRECHEEAWAFAHEGSLENYSPAIYLSNAQSHYMYNNNAVKMLLDKDTPVGMIELDTEKGENDGYGWLSFIYINPEYRFKGYGIQALARALCEYEKLGRNALRLNVHRKNTSAIRFYTKYGFNILEEDNNILLMERKLRNHFLGEINNQ